MSDFTLAMQAHGIFQKNKTEDRTYHVCDLAPWGIRSPISGTVIYVGCGFEVSPLFLFEGADLYIHQDLGDAKLFHAFGLLEKHGIVSNLEIVSNLPGERVYKFRYKGMPKTAVELFNSEENMEKHIHNGDVALNVHPLARKGLDVIYFWAFPYEDTIKALQINFLPYLRIGGLFEGSYYNSYHYGAQPSSLGLQNWAGTYRKERHLTGEEIEAVVGYSIDDYIEKELVFPWVLHDDKPKIREQARKRGVHFSRFKTRELLPF